MGLFDIFKRKPKLTGDQEMMAITLAMAKMARGEEVPGLKIETNPRDPRGTNVTMDPVAALALLEAAGLTGQAKPDPEPEAEVAASGEEYYVISGLVDDDEVNEIEQGPWDKFCDALDAAEDQADADGLVRNTNMEYTWTRNADDTELDDDYVTIEKR